MANIKTNREELLQNAFRLFVRMNYEKASYTELTKATGLSKAGICHYYPSKQELFIAVVNKYLLNVHDPRNKFVQSKGTLIEFIDNYVEGVQKALLRYFELIGKTNIPGQLSANADYYHFLSQVARYYPNAQKKMKEFTDQDYAYWRTAVQRAVKSGELKAGTDVEEAIVVFRQVYFGLSFEMSFFCGLDTEVLRRHLHYIYSLLKA